MSGSSEPGGGPGEGENAALSREADALFAEALAALRRRGTRIPLSTYRVQLNSDFTFGDAESLVPYWHDLGITDLYASPFFKARPHSLHGYDIVDHNSLNPEIGDEAAFDSWTDALGSLGMGMLLDFVPNHMGIGSSENAWWMDVLENGPSSLFAPFFDIDWEPLKSELKNKVLLPILGDHYGSVLESGELKLVHDQGAFLVHYWQHELPLNPRTYPTILKSMLPPLMSTLGEESEAVLELQSILTGLAHLPPRTESSRSRVIERRREKEILKRRLATLVSESPDVSRELDAAVARINGTVGEPRSFDTLDAILEDQPWRLSFWRVAAEEINYRRFFDVNDLAAIRMENPAVFERTHRLLMRLVGEGRITGIRIDHPDGLWDPAGYFTELHRALVVEHARRAYQEEHGSAATEENQRQLEQRFARLEPLLRERFDWHRSRDPHGPLRRPLYVVAEKILSRGEKLPEDWPIHGTSGYDFTASVGGLFVDSGSESAMTGVYERFIGKRIDFDDLVYRSKKLVLQSSLASELNVLAHELNRLSERDRHSRDFTLNSLTVALREVIACFPVYRTYVREDSTELTDTDRRSVDMALRQALIRNPTIDASVFRFLRAILCLEVPDTVAPEDRGLWRTFVMRFQQLTGPVMAKGLEDTSFYVYNRLVSLNEVGGEPEHFGQTVEAFHSANLERRTWPASLLATSTHDTKRSEDVRARISVLSEMPDEWERAVLAFRDAASAHATDAEGRRAPDPNEEYLFHQTLVGTWPFERPKGEELSGYTDRIVAYMRKATKEAKVNTSWVDATPDYDAAVEAFVRGALAEGSKLLDALDAFVPLIAFHGMWGSLSQTVLKIASPGVPDIYQGNELWDFSLVDPDNRRPVDFELRQRLLRELRRRLTDTSLARELVEQATDGRIKLHVTRLGLRTRRRIPDVFGPEGEYRPLSALGSRATHVVAFARTRGDTDVVAVVPRLTVRLCNGEMHPPIGAVWGDTTLALHQGQWEDVFTGSRHLVHDESGVRMSDLLGDFPVALLEKRG